MRSPRTSERRKGVVLIRGCFQQFHFVIFVVSVLSWFSWFLEILEFIVFKRQLQTAKSRTAPTKSTTNIASAKLGVVRVLRLFLGSDNSHTTPPPPKNTAQ